MTELDLRIFSINLAADLFESQNPAELIKTSKKIERYLVRGMEPAKRGTATIHDLKSVVAAQTLGRSLHVEE